MSYKIIKNFISEKEQEELVEWIIDNKNNANLFKDAEMPGSNRVTTRYSKDFSFPHTAYKIQRRIINQLKFKDFKLPKYHQGIVASYAGENDTVGHHLDPQWYPPYETLHCNVLLQKPLKGGKPIIDKETIDLDERDLWCYYVSKVEHGSSKVIGKKPRLMYVFGFCINYKEL
tara:strand:+ start:1782 stop:2300 length:519 start_codon:yes stop_codon:yes gene_type:complete